MGEKMEELNTLKNNNLELLQVAKENKNNLQTLINDISYDNSQSEYIKTLKNNLNLILEKIDKLIIMLEENNQNINKFIIKDKKEKTK